MSLHDELQRLADTAPRPYVDPTVWDRGRALRRRDRVVTSAVVLVMVLIVGGVASFVVGPPRAIAPADQPVPEGAIPSRIYTKVPDDLIKGPDPTYGEVSWADEVAEHDLAIGRASAAFAAQGATGSLPVVVGASDGTYHYLDLPGWLGAGTLNDTSGPSGLALSPDGTQLAYAWWDPTAPLDAPMPAGVRVVDLASGEIRTITLDGSNGVRVRALSWSPDSRWLAWAGEEMASWTPFSTGGALQVGGRIRPGSRTSETVPEPPNGQAGVGVTSSGTVVFVGTNAGRRVVTWDGTTSNFRTDADLTPERVATASPDGRSVAIGSWKASTDALFVATETGAVTPRELARGLDLYPDGAFVQPLGWATPDLVLSMVNPADGSEDISFGNSELVVMTPPSRPAAEWTYRVIGSVDGDTLTSRLSLSVAVDLIPDLDGTSSQQLTHDFEPPDWAQPRDISWLIGLGVAGALSVLYGLRWLWRRRTPLG